MLFEELVCFLPHLCEECSRSAADEAQVKVKLHPLIP